MAPNKLIMFLSGAGLVVALAMTIAKRPASPAVNTPAPSSGVAATPPPAPTPPSPRDAGARRHDQAAVPRVAEKAEPPVQMAAVGEVVEETDPEIALIEERSQKAFVAQFYESTGIVYNYTGDLDEVEIEDIADKNGSIAVLSATLENAKQFRVGAAKGISPESLKAAFAREHMEIRWIDSPMASRVPNCVSCTVQAFSQQNMTFLSFFGQTPFGDRSYFVVMETAAKPPANGFLEFESQIQIQSPK